MQDGIELKKQLLTLNTRSTTQDLDVSHSAYTLFRDSDLDSKQLRKHLIKKFKNNEIDLLDQEFKSAHFSEQFINEFFEDEYESILHWLLIGSSNNNSFNFILNVFPHEALKKKLKENNFYYLTGLLNGHAAMEELGLLTEKESELNKERFMLLLKIDPEGVQDFMKINENANFMKPSALKSYKLALQSLQLDQSSLTEKKISIKNYNPSKENNKPVLFSNSHINENTSSSSASTKRASPEKKEEEKEEMKKDSPLKRNKHS